MMPPPSSGLLAQTVKTFVLAAALPITLPVMLYKAIKGKPSADPFDPFNMFNSSNGYYGQQDPRYQQGYTNENPYYQQNYQDSNRGYGKRMEWQYIPGFGWRYVEVEYGPDNGYANGSNYYEDFEDFFENARRQQQQQQQQQQSWNYEDIFGNRSGMSRQEAYKILGLQYSLLFR